MTGTGQIRARVDAATPGPWWAEEIESSVGDGWEILAGGVFPAPAYCDPESGYHGPFDEVDAAFVASARTDVPYLLALVDELRAKIAAVRRMTAFLVDVGADPAKGAADLVLRALDGRL